MTNHDVKNYLEKIYKVPIAQISSRVMCGKITQAPGGRHLIKSTDDFRFVEVFLADGQKFKYPNLFPEKQTKEQDKEEEVFRKQMDRDTIIAKKENWKRSQAPSWFGI